MHPAISQRLANIREIATRPWVRVLLGLWGLSGIWDLAISQWIPEEYAKHLPKVYQVVAMTTGLVSWEVWLLVGAAIVVAGAIEYAFRHKRQLTEALQRGTGDALAATATVANSPTPPILPKPLKELFDSDFPSYGKKVRPIILTFEGDKKIDCVMYVHQDFESGSEFISFYIPKCGITPQVCDYFAYNFRQDYDQLKTQIHFNIRAPGEMLMDRSAKLNLSGRVWLYYEDEMSYQELAQVTQLFESKGLNVRFRGPSYVTDEWRQRLLRV